MTNRLELNWKLDGFVDEQRYYCSETPIDPENPPAPKVILAGDIRTYTDTDIVSGKTYYVRVGSVKGSIEKVSQEVEIFAGSDPHWDNVVALLHFDGDFSDLKGGTWVASGASATIDTSIIKFGTGSLKAVGGSSLNATIPSLGTDDFTIEFNIYPLLVNGSWQRYFAIGGFTKPGSFYMLNVGASNPPRVLIGMNSNFNLSSQGPETTLNMLAWNHVAVTRENGTMRIFINGLLRENITWPTFDINETFAQINDEVVDGSNAFNAHYDELRITKGVARYTENFTPPDSPFLNY